MRTTPLQARPVLLAILLVAAGLAVIPPVSALTVTATLVQFNDADNNGHVDRVVLTFDNAGVDVASIRPSDFQVSVAGQAPVTATGIAGTPTANSVTLTIPESAGLDGGAQTASSVTLVAGHGLRAAGGDTLAGTLFPTANNRDIARPLFLAAYGKPGENTIIVTFSEPVRKDGGAALAIGDFTVDPSCSDSALGTLTLGGTSPTNVYTIKLGGSAVLKAVLPGTCDVDVLAFEDAAANDHIGGLTQVVGPPTIKTVHANRGDTRVIVEFKGPVTNVAGNLAAVVAGSGNFNGFTIATPAAYTNWAVLTSSNAVNSADLTGPSKVEMTTGVQSVAGPAAGGTTPAAVPAVTQQVSLSDATGSGDNVGPPFPVEMVALDLYTGNPLTTAGADGCLDTVRIRWNENIKDSSIATGPYPSTGFLDVISGGGADNGWRILVPTLAAAQTPTHFATLDANDVGAAAAADDAVVYLYFANTASPCAIGSKFRSDALLRVSFCDPVAALDFTGSTVSCNAGAPTDVATSPADLALAAPQGGPATIRLFPVVDGAPPVVLEAKSLDTNANGKVDQVLVQFSEPINDGALVTTEWQVRGNPTTGDGATQGSVYTITAVTTGATPNDDTIILQVAEKVSPDTGMVPDVAYTFGATRIRDRGTGALPLATISFDTAGSRILPGREKDAAAPVLVTMTGTEGSNTAYVTFSEPIPGDCVYSGASPVAAGHRRITPCFGFPIGSTVAATDPDVGGTTVTLTNGKYRDNAPTNTAWDAAECVYVSAGGTVAVGDLRVTPCGAFPARSIVATGDADAGATVIATALTPTIRDLNGDTTIHRISGNDFRYRDNNNAGVTGVSTAVLDTSDTSGRRMIVTLNGPPAPAGLTASDISGGTRDCMQVKASFLDTSDNKGRPQFDETPTTAGTTCIGFTASTGPTVTGTETVDANADGSLDAIKITFSANVNDGDIGTSNVGRWAVRFAAVDSTVRDIVTGAYGRGTTVTTGDLDITGGTLVAPPPGVSTFYFYDANDATAGYDARDCVYYGAVGKASVDTTLTRVTSCGAYKMHSTPATGDMDVGKTVSTLTNGMLKDIATAGWNPGECVYVSTDTAVSSGDTRVTSCSAAHTAWCTGALGPVASQDNILFVCFAEQLDVDGAFRPNTALLPTLSYAPSTGPGSNPLREPSPGFQPVGGFVDRATTDGAPPVLVRANGNPGSNTATLTFSEFVVSNAGSNIAPADLVYSNSVSGTIVECPSNASNVASITTYSAPAGNGALTMTVTLNGAATYFDIAGCATAPGQVPDGMRPNTAAVREPTSAGGKNAVANGVVLNGPGIVTFVDNGKPTIAAAGFVDMNGDGTVDTVQIRFSEAIKDSVTVSAKTDWTVQAGSAILKVTATFTGGDLDPMPASVKDFCRESTGASDDVFPVGKPVGYVNTDDEYLFLCLEDVASVAQTTFGLGTGITGLVSYATAGTRITDRAMTPHTLDDVAGITVADLARPAVLCTGSPCDIAKTMPETADRDGDGKIDAIKIVFSEKVSDTTFNPIDWSVEARAITGLDTQGDDAVTPGTASVNDATIWIKFAEGANPDTGLGSSPAQINPNPNPLPPTVSYADTGGMRDAAGNAVRGYSPARVRDGAPPVVISVQATQGSDLVVVGFSEPVRGTEASRAIGLNDVSYQNNAATGATSVIAVFHTRDDSAMTVKLNAPVTVEDIQQDKLVFVTAGIVSKDGTVAAPLPSSFPRPLNLLTQFGPLNGQIGDQVPPAAIADLEVEQISSGSVKLKWTTPTANDLNKFEVYHCKLTACPITQSNFQSKTLVATGLPAPTSGNSQSATLTSLTDGDEYTFVIVTVDQNGNRAQISNEVKATPRARVTAEPPALSDLRLESATSTSVTISWEAPTPQTGTGIGAYRIVVRAQSAATLTQTQFEAATQATFVLSPSTPTATGRQQATITGLSQGDQIKIYVAMVDDQVPPLVGDFAQLNAVVQSTTGSPGPVTALVVAAGSATGSASVSWTAPTGAPLAQSYEVTARIGACPGSGTPVTTTVNAPTTTAELTGLSPGGTYCFSVAAKVGTSASSSVTSAFKVPAAPDSVPASDLEDANQGVIGGLKAVYKGSDEGVALTWKASGAIDGKQPLGYQVWRCATPPTGSTCASYVLAGNVTATSFTDDDGLIDTDGRADGYIVTAYYGYTVADGFASDPAFLSDIPGSDEDPVLATQAASPLSFFTSPLGIGILAAVLLLILLLVLLLVLKARKKKGGEAAGAFDEQPAEGGEGGEASWAEPEAPAEEATWNEPPAETPAQAAPSAEPEGAWAEPQTAAAAGQVAVQESKPADTHYLTCPQCASVFRAKGMRPFVAQCPSCGVKGRFN